ncbi:hypothetical protein OG756_26920 [Streptomyces sp. NBC_01310]|uniref:hypothetical protein n=1 Tax=Streptomyces sp. NBC_01310 TaxID=2903820 RepID=UPI0035B5EB0E|nr:hypothetical protein OG756_26920 [Streptomyces sp. NBC_01310]
MDSEALHERIGAHLRAEDPRLRQAAARQAAAVAWEPDQERYLASALADAAGREDDPAALAAELDALPAVEPALDDLALQRLAGLRTDSPVVAALLARAARLQIAGPAEPVGDGTRVVVRCVRGIPHTGLPLRTRDGAWVVLQRIEFYGKAVDRLDPGCSGRVLLSGHGARELAEWDCLDAEPGAREYVPGLRSADPRARRRAAEGIADRPDAWAPEVGRYLCGALARAAVRETDHGALESQLKALLGLHAFLAPPAYALLRTLDRGALPEALRPCLDRLLEVQAPDAVR